MARPKKTTEPDVAALLERERKFCDIATKFYLKQFPQDRETQVNALLPLYEAFAEVAASTKE